MKNSVKKATVALLVRQGFVFLSAVILNLFLTKMFSSVTVGELVIFNTILSGFAYLSDGGIWVGFIQQKQHLTDQVFNSMFSFVTIVSLFLAVVFLTITFAIPIEIFVRHDLILYVLAIFLLATVNSVYSAKMQRDLKISQVALVELICTAVNFGVTVVLVLVGFGIESVFVGLLVKAALNLIVSVAIVRYIPALDFHFRRPDFLSGLKNGMVNQLSFPLNYLRTLLNPVVTGSFVGIAAIGLVDRAIMFSGVPANVISLTVQRVFFPYFSLMLREGRDVRPLVSETIFFSSVLDKFYYIPLLLLIERLINDFLGSRWAGVSQMVYILTIGNMIWGGLAAVVICCLMAISRYSFLTRWNAAVTFFSLGAGLVATYLWGVIGYVAVTFLLWFPTPFLLKKVISELGKFSVAYEVLYPLSVSVLTLFLTEGLRVLIGPKDLLLDILFTGTFSFLCYVGVLLLTERRYLPQVLARLFSVPKKEPS